MQTRLDRPGRDPEPLGDGLDRQIGPEAKDERDSVVRGQELEGASQLVARMDHVAEVTRLGGLVRGRGKDLDDRATSPYPEPVATRVDDDPREPRFEALGISQPLRDRQASECCIRNGLLGLGGTAQDDGRQPVCTVEMIDHEALKRRLGSRHGAKSPGESWSVVEPIHPSMT